MHAQSLQLQLQLCMACHWAHAHLGPTAGPNACARIASLVHACAWPAALGMRSQVWHAMQARLASAPHKVMHDAPCQHTLTQLNFFFYIPFPYRQL